MSDRADPEAWDGAAFAERAESLRRGTLTGNVVAFVRLLREAGLPLTTGDAIAAARALLAVGVASRDDAHTALAATLVRRPSERPLFEALFEQFWARRAPRAAPPAIPREVAASARGSGPPARLGRHEVPEALYAGGEGRPPRAAPGSYSGQDLLTRRDFSSLSPDELAAMRRLIRALAPRLASALARRRRAARFGRELDLRRSMRRAARRHGELRELERRRRRRRRTRLVVLADVSGSMDLYSRFLAQFLYGLQQELRGVSTFVFSTRLFEVTPMLRARSFDRALRLVSSSVDAWSGGTQIGAALADFNRRYARERVGSDTVVVVLSDGWDRGDASSVRREMASLHRRARRVIWLNPLLGAPGYQPLAGGMAAALPYCDDFLPAHSVESLAALGRRLLALEGEAAGRGSPSPPGGDRMGAAARPGARPLVGGGLRERSGYGSRTGA